MSDRIIKLIVLFAVATIINACARAASNQENQPDTSCAKLPKGFSEKDLIGTWSSDYMNGNVDTIIIRDDGTYKQIFSSNVNNLDFESNWQKWWLESRDSGYLRLHLEGMRRCDDLESICQSQNGGVDPNLYRIVDYCENKIVSMQGEVVLIVTGAKYAVMNGIVLRHATLSGSNWQYIFELQNLP
jgi:hypothetical protein